MSIPTGSFVNTPLDMTFACADSAASRAHTLTTLLVSGAHRSELHAIATYYPEFTGDEAETIRRSDLRVADALRFSDRKPVYDTAALLMDDLMFNTALADDIAVDDLVKIADDLRFCLAALILDDQIDPLDRHIATWPLRCLTGKPMALDQVMGSRHLTLVTV